MGEERGPSWQEVATANRERIRILEKELDRQREAVHAIRGEVASIRYLATKIGELAEDVKLLASRVETVSRHAVNRPTQSGLAVFGQYIGLIVAVVALVIAAKR